MGETLWSPFERGQQYVGAAVAPVGRSVSGRIVVSLHTLPRVWILDVRFDSGQTERLAFSTLADALTHWRLEHVIDHRHPLLTDSERTRLILRAASSNP